MAVTIGVNLFVSWYEAREGRRLKSAFLVADAAHTRADLYVSLGVVLSFAAALWGLGGADPLVAAAIAAVIAWQAGRILLSAFDVLTDRAVIPAEMIEPLAAAVPGVLRVHDVRSRGRRDAVFVDLTVHLDGSISLHEAHDIADRIERDLEESHPEIVDVVVHLEPEGHVEGRRGD
jgi:cation diffusion facilitator family transporter